MSSTTSTLVDLRFRANGAVVASIETSLPPREQVYKAVDKPKNELARLVAKLQLSSKRSITLLYTPARF